jgi:hypothetical protein
MSPAASMVRNLSGRRLGRYEVLAQLASGGMATVYVARARGVAGFERLVAIKVLHPHLAHDDEFISMFLDEARLAARIRHPNVVPTLDISDSQGDGYFLVMEYVEGDHFGSLLRGLERTYLRTSRCVWWSTRSRGSAPRMRSRARTASRSGSSTATSPRTTSSSAPTESPGSPISVSRRPRCA